MSPEPAAATSYDEIPYPGRVHYWGHPDRLATRALLAGLQPAPVEKCRVLELGCGDGTNLVALADGLPASQLLGVDLAARPLEDGRAMAAALGLKNVELRQQDMLKIGADFGEFDYIVAPGIYSWVPENVRDKLLAICRACLAPHGVAVISYNAYPGCYFSTQVRDMMVFHVRAIDDPRKKARQARGLLKLLAATHSKPSAYKLTLDQELKRLAGYDDAVLLHDDLCPHYHPVFFEQFAAHAARHGLQYLGEQREFVLDLGEYPPALQAPLQQLDNCDVISREQYLDFIHSRRFRCTLLCRDDVTLQREPQPGAIRQFRLASDAKPSASEASTGDVTFDGGNGSLAKITHPLAIAAMLEMSEAWPRSVPFDELLAAARERGMEQVVWTTEPAQDAATLEAFLHHCRAIGVAEFHVHQPLFVTVVSERPTVSPLARLKLASDRFVPSRTHMAVAMDDLLGRQLLALLDGTRDRATILRELNGFITSGSLPEVVEPVTAEQLEDRLAALATLALLVS